ncbi:MAG: hypothetical protein ACRCW1_07785 [Anaerotignaceae bacterium]
MISKLKEQEISLFQAFAMSRTLFSSNLKSFFIISIVFGLPINILSSYIWQSLANVSTRVDFQNLIGNQLLMQQFVQSPEFIAITALYAILILVNFFMFPIIALATSHLTYTILSGAPASPKASMLEAFAKGHTFIFASIVYCIGTTVGLIFLIPGILLIVYWYFYIYAIMLDDAKGLSSLRISTKFVKGNFIKTAMAALVVYATNYSAIYLSSFLFISLGDTIIIDIISGIVSTLINTFFYCAVTIYYINRKAVVEGTAPKSDIMF